MLSTAWYINQKPHAVRKGITRKFFHFVIVAQKIGVLSYKYHPSTRKHPPCRYWQFHSFPIKFIPFQYFNLLHSIPINFVQLQSIASQSHEFYSISIIFFLFHSNHRYSVSKHFIPFLSISFHISQLHSITIKFISFESILFFINQLYSISYKFITF